MTEQAEVRLDAIVFRSTATNKPFSDESWPYDAERIVTTTSYDQSESESKHETMTPQITLPDKELPKQTLPGQLDELGDATFTTQDNRSHESQVDAFGLSYTWNVQESNGPSKCLAKTATSRSVDIDSTPTTCLIGTKSSRPRPISLDMAEQFFSEEIKPTTEIGNELFDMNCEEQLEIKSTNHDINVRINDDTSVKVLPDQIYNETVAHLSTAVTEIWKPRPPIRSNDTKLMSTDMKPECKKPVLPTRNSTTKLTSLSNNIEDKISSRSHADTKSSVKMENRLILSNDCQLDRISKLKAELNARKVNGSFTDNLDHKHNNSFESDHSNSTQEWEKLCLTGQIGHVNPAWSNNICHPEKNTNGYSIDSVKNELHRSNKNIPLANEHPCWTDSVTSHDTEDADWLPVADGRAPQVRRGQCTSSFGRGKVLDQGLLDYSHRDVAVSGHNSVSDNNIRNIIGGGSNGLDCYGGNSNETTILNMISAVKSDSVSTRDILRVHENSGHEHVNTVTSKENCGDIQRSLNGGKNILPSSRTEDTTPQMTTSNVSNPWYRFLTNRKSGRSSNKPKIPPKPPALRCSSPNSPPPLPARQHVERNTGVGGAGVKRSGRLEAGLPGSNVSSFYSQSSSTLPPDITLQSPTFIYETTNTNQNTDTISSEVGNSTFHVSRPLNSSSSALDSVPVTESPENTTTTTTSYHYRPSAMSASTSNVSSTGKTNSGAASSAQRASLWRKWREEASALLGNGNGNKRTNNENDPIKNIQSNSQRCSKSSNGITTTNTLPSNSSNSSSSSKKKNTSKVAPLVPVVQYQSYCVGADKYDDEVTTTTHRPMVVTSRPPLPRNNHSIVPAMFRRKPHTKSNNNNSGRSISSPPQQPSTTATTTTTCSIDSPTVALTPHHHHLQQCTTTSPVSCVCGAVQCTHNNSLCGDYNNDNSVGAITNADSANNIASPAIILNNSVSTVYNSNSNNGYSSTIGGSVKNEAAAGPPAIVHLQPKCISGTQYNNANGDWGNTTSRHHGAISGQFTKDCNRASGQFVIGEQSSPLLETDLDTGASRDLLDQIGRSGSSGGGGGSSGSGGDRGRSVYSSGRSLQQFSDRTNYNFATPGRSNNDVEPCTDLDDLQKDLNELLSEIQNKYSSRNTDQEEHNHQFVRSRSAVFSSTTKFSLAEPSSEDGSLPAADRISIDGQGEGNSSGEYGHNSMTSDRTTATATPTTTCTGSGTSNGQSSEVLSRARSLVAVNMCSSNRNGAGVSRADRNDERTRSLEHLLDGEDMAVSTAAITVVRSH